MNNPLKGFDRFKGFPLIAEEYSNSRRRREGWAYTDCDIGIEYRREDDRSTKFTSDEEAIAFVKKCAEEGSEYHQQVLAYIASRRLTR